MQRDPRHDHGFLKPDPLVTRELGIPNACNRCHADKSTDWAIESADRWYGARLDSRQRTRARVVAAAQKGDADAAPRLLALLASEDVPVWRATLLQLARPYVESEPRLADTARAALNDPEPMVRSAAAQLLGRTPTEFNSLRPLLRDPSKLVRLDAEWALSGELADASAERKELGAYLALSADQPAGEMRVAQDLFNRHRAADAEAPLRKAIAWDSYSPPFYETLGVVLESLGRESDAAAALWRGAQANPQQAALAYQAGLAFAAAHKLPDAELALREATRRDDRFDRAWYNLALLLAQTHRPAEAITILQKAEALAPNVADYPYARAMILFQQQDRPGARAALRRVLVIDPTHGQARELLRNQ